MDFKDALIGILMTGIGIGIATAWLLPWLWQVLKPYIHALTA